MLTFSFTMLTNKTEAEIPALLNSSYGPNTGKHPSQIGVEPIKGFFALTSGILLPLFTHT